MAEVEKSLTVRMTEIARKNNRLLVNFVFMVCGLRSSINSTKKKNVDRLPITKQALQVSVNRN